MNENINHISKEEVSKVDERCKTVIAHLGAHKTATSLVQKYFKSKREYYEENGILALTRGSVSPFISWGDRITQEPQGLNNHLKSAATRTDCEYIFLSNENALGRPFTSKPGLYPNHRPIIEAFPNAFEGFSTRIVYTIRPQWEYLESYYLQRVHQGYYLTFSQFLDDIDLTEISWLPLVDRLRSVFGAENVQVMDFSLIRKGQDVFLREFIRRNISSEVIPDLDYDETHNASISDRGLQMALRVNPLLKQGETGVVRRFLQQHFSNRTEPRPVLLSDTLRSELIARYQGEYDFIINRG